MPLVTRYISGEGSRLGATELSKTLPGDPGVGHRMQVIVVLVVRADSCATVAVGVLTSIESADVQCSSRAFAVAVAMIA